MKRWMSETEIDIITDWKEGSPITIRGDLYGTRFEVKGVVLQFEPERFLEYTHLSSLSELADKAENYSILEFRLEPKENETILVLTLSNFPTETIYKHFAFYWNGALELLRRSVESQRSAISEIQAYIGSIEGDPSLYEEKNFDKRMEVIDFIGFQVMDRIEEALGKAARPDELVLLKDRAEKARVELEEIDARLFERLRRTIRTGECRGKAFRKLVSEYVGFSNEDGYDNLDIFINGLSPIQTMPEQTRDLEPEMVYYQKTPARIVFELVEKAHFVPGDVFFDLGSGLGQAAILVNLLAGIVVRGIEIEPAFCDYAKDCAAELNLTNVTFLNVDARKADYSGGTVFFMFTPFKGEMLQDVLAVLRKESLDRKIKIIAYGPCTAEVALQDWLDFVNPGDDHPYRLGIFNSVARGLQ